MRIEDLIELDELTEDVELVSDDHLQYKHTSDYISDIEDVGYLSIVSDM